MTHRALLVDDESIARLALGSLLRERGDVVVVGEAASIEDAARKLERLQPDVVFLDVQMRSRHGFELLREVTHRAQVIVVTAFSDHALRAFEIGAVDYLLKPVHRHHLDRALARLRAPSGASEASEWPPPVFPHDAGSVARLGLHDRVCLQRGQDMVFARVSNVVFLLVEREYTAVHLASGRVQVVREPLQRWAERLPMPPFVRIHRGCLINADHLEELRMTDGSWWAKMERVDEPLPVSRRLAPGLRGRLGGE